MIRRGPWGWIAAALLVASAVPAIAQAAASGLGGDWDGTIEAGAGVKLRLIFHIENHEAITTGSLVSVDQGNARTPIEAIARDGNVVTWNAPKVHGQFKGKVSADGTTLTGTWTQRAPMPLTLIRRRVGAPDPVAPRRPQEPKPPFPYETKDVVFPGPDGIQLAGTLTSPIEPGSVPAVVLIQGSGPYDRDETIMGHKPSRLLADTLSRRGIAVLRVDKRGVGQSTGRFETATTQDFAADTEAATTFLRTLKSINPRKIGLIGHSEGGLIAPMVAARDHSLAFIVLLAGPGLKGPDLLLLQQRLIGQVMGVSPAKLDEAAALNRQVFNIVRTSKNLDEAKAEVRVALAAASVPSDRTEAVLGQVATPWFRFLLTYDPIPALQQVKCPVLAINGSLDTQVPPKEDLAAIQGALSSNRDVTVRELPGLNHLFQTAKTGAPNEYADIEETISPQALVLICDWVEKRVVPKSSSPD